MASVMGLTFKNSALLDQAFVHRSYANESPIPIEDNERLEFLGDAVLNFISGSFLYRMYPQFSEEKLTKLRSNLVDEPHLATLARELRLNERLQLGQGEQQGHGSDKDSILSDAFEAVIGAYFLDAGIEAVREFVEPLLSQAIAKMAAQQDLDKHLGDRITDAKSRLQEWMQRHHGKPPTYRLIEERGEPHNRIFVVQVWGQGKLLGTGIGSRKRAAEQEAAQEAIRHLQEAGLMSS
ncbi:ribonuclease III [Phormidium yuhuli AB48]|uniref:Ribonuclease 3 n=1 Tax=Phormidium yuhuli AB48 TaxID=2940671 RepID=A0ABY5AVH6_9CYAN|nr:ribonuclease III [Phormidium yuhuli]USR93050.1 ribonuclease III [Phormidium yuhuli AB48]